MAWNLVKRLGRAHRLWVLTAAQNREAIAAVLEKQPLADVQFVYIDLPGWLHALLRHQAGIQLYAYLWQWRAYFVARRLHKQVRFHAFHHVTYENDWMASIIGALLPIPYVRGPAGGAHRVPKSFRKQFPARSYLWEYIRMALQWIFRLDPFFALGHERAKVLLMANREALGALPARWRRKARLLSVNGIAGEELVPPQQQAPSEKFAVLSAGRLVPLKGFDLALRAFAIFAARRPEADFTIVGQGPEGNRLESLIRELGLEKQARMVSWMPRERLLATMRCCDVFLFASLRDGGGLVVVEAMAAGKPVVCFDLGGPGLHVNEDCGFKVTARDPEQGVRDMAAALEKLAADRSLCTQMGRAAFERARQVYDWDRVAEQIIQAYEKALGVSASQ
jgi:glycosyltransferase involved in cell wall biosynthesis